MTVYVDDMSDISMGEFKTKSGRTYKMSHCIADTKEELLAMMSKIGVELKWIQYEGTWKEHFDITKSKKALAIKAGAVAIPIKQLVRMTVIRRETGKLGTLEETNA